MGTMRFTFPQHLVFHRYAGFLHFFSLVLLLSLFSGCAEQPAVLPVEDNKRPVFIDDSDRSNLLACAEKHLEFLSGLPKDHTAVIGDRTYPRSWLLHSLESFMQIVDETPEQLQFHKRIRDEFHIFKASGRKEGPKNKMLVTGYYEPFFEGSLEPVPPYIHPLYSLPDILVKINSDTPETKQVGRYDSGNRFVPFWTRHDIETSDVLSGYEIVYLKDPFDAFLLHVQGSGRIQFPNGTVKSVRYAGHNGHVYNSIGKLLVDEKKIRLEDASIPAIRDYLARNPNDFMRVLHHNPRYIFFEWGHNEPPRGCTGVSLTPGRSIAVDHHILPSETVCYLISKKPVVDRDGQILDWLPLTRFAFAQDSGSAIKGAGRVDLFFGNGTYAEAAAGSTAEEGELYFLIKKGYGTGSQQGVAAFKEE